VSRPDRQIRRLGLSALAAWACLASQALAQDGATVFGRRCASCHASGPTDPDKLGPNLFGVVGRPSGARAGFQYSAALAGGKLRWSEATLDRFLAEPRKTAPGNAMMFAGLSRAEDRAVLIQYLKAQRAR
jgi:cytochrome c